MTKTKEKGIVYVVPQSGFSFSVPVIDSKTGKQAVKKNALTGEIIELISETIDFQTTEKKVINGEAVSACKFLVNDTTSEVITNRLKELHRQSLIMTQEEYIKLINPNQHKAEEKLKEKEIVIDEQKSTIDIQTDTIKKLNERLAKVEKKGKK